MLAISDASSLELYLLKKTYLLQTLRLLKPSATDSFTQSSPLAYPVAPVGL
jgi:hypothetical protein